MYVCVRIVEVVCFATSLGLVHLTEAWALGAVLVSVSGSSISC